MGWEAEKNHHQQAIDAVKPGVDKAVKAAIKSAVDRSSQPEVRNPLLALPAAQELIALAKEHPEVGRALKRLLREAKAQARQEEERCYRQRKGPLVAHWMAAGTYMGHLANVFGKGLK